jgi:hypothetical protein
VGEHGRRAEGDQQPYFQVPHENGFVMLREVRDRTSPMPRLILHALQVDINGGCLPQPGANGKRYLKFPLDAL